MSRRSIVATSLWLCLSATTLAQPIFNRKFHFDRYAAVLTGLYITDTAYFAIGIVADTFPNSPTGALFVKFDLEGNPIITKVLSSPEKTFETWSPVMLSTASNTFITCGYGTDIDGRYGLLIEYNSQGDTIRTKKILNPNYPNRKFIAPITCFIKQNQEIIISSNFQPLLYQAADIYITSFTQNFNLINEVVYGNNRINGVGAMLQSPDSGNFIISGVRSDENLVDYNFILETMLIGVDAEGNLLWEYYTPEEEVWGGGRDITWGAEPGSVIVATAKGERWNFPIGGQGDSLTIVVYRNAAFKLNAQREKVWEKVFYTSYPHPTNCFWKIIPAGPEGGYVLAGEQFFPPEDTITDKSFGMLAKISEDGDSLWSRYFNVLEAPPYHHKFNDIKLCADGGFLICGQALDQRGVPVAEPIQQAWLLKVDEYGCLVPGCQGPVSTSEQNPVAEILLQLFPNPAQDYLNIHLKTTKDLPGRLRVLNASGALLTDYAVRGQDVTHILPLDQWPSGSYFLQYWQEGQLLATEAFLKH